MASRYSLLLLLSLLAISFLKPSEAEAPASRIVTYWGQNVLEGTLAEACATGHYEIINIAFLISIGSGQTPVLNLAGHCDPAASTCTALTSEIDACHRQGVKLFLSLNGGIESNPLSSTEDAQRVSDYLWNNFLGGQSNSRPLGRASLDGIDFYMVSGKGEFWPDLARALKEHDVNISASPQCPIPDYYLDALIKTGLFEYVWVQFYNNPTCQYSQGNAGALLASWDKWTEANARKIFLGIPAAPEAASSGYIPPNDLLSQVLPGIESSSKYGGIMLWNRFYDQQNGYSESINNGIEPEPEPEPAPGIVTYWGQNVMEGTLAEACATGYYNIVNIAYLISIGSGQTPVLNLAGHCEPAACTALSSQIDACQRQGVKVFLSLNGGIISNPLSSPEDAQRVSDYLWNNFLGGQSNSRPLGPAILDGIDFYMVSGLGQFWPDLAKALKAHNVGLSAAPQCPIPDFYLDASIKTGLFDYVWIRFYNNPTCEYNPGNAGADLFASWNQWNQANTSRIFLGIPAAPEAATSGYIPPNDFISQVLPRIKSSSKYGGVMLWNRFFDQQSGYSAVISNNIIIGPKMMMAYIE